MKLNELVCPSCGLKCMTDASYTTCASCQTTFSANQSRSVDNPVPLGQPGSVITWPTIIGPTLVGPTTIPQPNHPTTWVTVGDPPPYRSVSTGGTVGSTDQTGLQVWN